MSVIIDRRLNERNKSAGNRARFMRRYKKQIRRAVSERIGERSIRDMATGGEVEIPAGDISEPRWRHGDGGMREIVLPGNREFESGDRLKRPQGQGGGGNGEGGEGEGDEDNFTFALSRDEFMEIFFDDLELPHMLRTEAGDITEPAFERAGYTRDGAPVNLSVVRTMQQALGRRIALSGAARRRVAEIERQQASDAGADDADRDAAQPDEATTLELDTLRARIARVPFLDEIDLRFRHRVQVPKPVSRAVMFCLMDVSASMDEHRKDLGKRFFTLLYLFLSRKYERVEIIFIRHTDDAEEVDEQTFFHDRKTGGTVVLSALTLMHEIMQERFPADSWNVYGAQASDGDAFGVDPERSRVFLQESLIPDVRHFAYIEVCERPERHQSTLASAYARIDDERFAMREVNERRDIYPVFRELFSARPTRVPG